MDTPITISSTLSSVEKSPKRNIIPHPEIGISRVPVSWDSPLKACDRESNCTPSTLQKVNNWINSLNRLSRDHVESNNSSNRQSSDFSDYDMPENGLNMQGDLVSNIVKPGYSKSGLKDRIEEEVLDAYSSSSNDYDDVNGTQSTSKDQKIYGGGPKKHFHPKAIKRRKSLPNYKLVEQDDGGSDKSDSDIPLSPESEKKKELCSYLQLMKPTDKKTVMILQNRRSVRVKNLSLMHEKRELEKKLRAAQVENSTDNGISDNTARTDQNFPGLKSFAEMNVDLDRTKHQWLQYSGIRNDTDELFSFPTPTNNLRKTINDFDDVKVDWLEKKKEESVKKDCRIVSSKIETNVQKEVNRNVGNNNMSSVMKSKKENETNKNQLNIIPDKVHFKNRIDTIKKDFVSKSENPDLKRRVGDVGSDTVTDNNTLKTKIIKIHKEGNVNGCRKNDIVKTRRKSFPSGEPQLVIPRPSMHLVEDINDFEVIIKQNEDLIKNNVSPSSNKEKVESTKTKSKMLDTSKVVKSPSSFNKLENKGPKIESKIIEMPKTKVHSDTAEVEKSPSSFNKLKSKNPKTENKIFNPRKSKTPSLNKKTKVKKLHAERKVPKSCFKIKLTPKRKSGDTTVTRTKSHLISDIISLRNRNIDNPSAKINSIKKKVKKEQKDVYKKENIKQKDGQPNGRHVKVKHSEENRENVKVKQSNDNIKLNLKDPVNNKCKNPVQTIAEVSIITESPDKNINSIVKEGESKLTPSKTQIKSSEINHLENLMLDTDFSNLSTAHKTSLLDKNVNQQPLLDVPIIAIYNKNENSNDFPRNKFEKKKNTNRKEKYEFYSQILNIEKDPDEVSLADLKNPKIIGNVNTGKINERQQYAFNNNENQISLLEKVTETDFPDLHSLTSVSKGCSTPVSSKEKLEIITDQIHKNSNDSTPFISFKKDVGIRSLHNCLNILTQKSVSANLEVESSPTSWPSESPSHKRKKNQHSINISKEHGLVLKAFYLEYNLVLCQEFMVSFWTQTALGNVLGAQNMWIHKGSVQRLAINNNCIFKESLEMVVSTDNNVAYIELWTKEHQSEIREGPVADVFATVYFWRKGQNGLDKKVLQLENINGFADDVQYSVLKSTPKIIVSWHLACSEVESKKTFIHCYQLAADYQTVYNISEFEAVEHYVSSLHNIEGCDSLVMGCGENKITLWNIEYGYVVATIEMSEIKSPLCTLWVKCDKGFLFTLQQCVDKELRLIAIHGMNHSWKKLASYVPPDEYDRLKGVCVENGIVLAFYDQGILCWNAQTSETIVEELHNEAEYISGKYVISVVNDQVNIRHAITHLLSAEDS